MARHIRFTALPPTHEYLLPQQRKSSHVCVPEFPPSCTARHHLTTGNSVGATSSLCTLQKQLEGIVVTNHGWSMVNEGTESKPKWGYVSTTPGGWVKWACEGGGALCVPLHLQTA